MVMSTPKGRSPTRSLTQRMLVRISSAETVLWPSMPMPPALETATVTSRVCAKAMIGYSQPYSSQSRVCSGSCAIRSHLRARRRSRGRRRR